MQIKDEPKLIAKQQEEFLRFGWRVMYVPALAESRYPKYFVRLDRGAYLEPGLIEKRPLSGLWLAVETLAKPDWQGRNRYRDDQLGQAIGLKNRFGISPQEIYRKIIPAVAIKVGVPSRQIRLPSAEEWNFISNTFNELRVKRGEKLPDLGATNSWEWCANAYGLQDQLIAGFCASGGLSALYSNKRADPCIGFRLIITL